MKRNRLFYTCLFSLMTLFSWAQEQWNGTVVDKNQQPLFAVNVYFSTSPTKGTVTDFNGNFNIKGGQEGDHLIFSYIGYISQKIPFSQLQAGKEIHIILKEDIQHIKEVRISAQDPISKKFAVEKIDRISIYLDPVAQGDPLKAVAQMAASTSTDETANPSLRGSDATRSRVFLNGVPIYNPVRSSNLDNQGFFSIFNTELIKQQFVYASNPPLTHGNSSAGMIDIQTQDKLEKDQLQLSAGLLNTGFLLSKRIKGDNTFVHAYGNRQFSDLYKELHKEQLPDLNAFYATDMGIYSNIKIAPKWNYSIYQYYINEKYSGIDHQANYTGEVESQNRRWFNVQAISFASSKWKASLHLGYDQSNKDYQSGELYSDTFTEDWFVSGDLTYLATHWLSLQTGTSYQIQKYQSDDLIPPYGFVPLPDIPGKKEVVDLKQKRGEIYGYANIDLSEKISMSLGVRKPFSYNENQDYTAFQSSVSIEPARHHHILISGGKYFSFLPCSYYNKSFEQQESRQYSLDYSYHNDRTTLEAAVYYKKEKGGDYILYKTPIDHQTIKGAELSFKQTIGERWQWKISNSWIDQKIFVEQKEYTGKKDLQYLVKSSLQYQTPKGFSCTLSYQTREGIPYTPIVDHGIDHGVYYPIYSTNFNEKRHNNYQRFDLNISQYTTWKRQTFVFFATVNNLLNQKNVASIYYDKDFSQSYDSYYTLRTFFVGMVWKISNQH
ncbi:MAG: TonB-dependent receptor [Prolixibacteraceae bacterium]|nr:TonB-dependent receptor [Prolixibacteraceae bacterium]